MRTRDPGGGSRRPLGSLPNQRPRATRRRPDSRWDENIETVASPRTGFQSRQCRNSASTRRRLQTTAAQAHVVERERRAGRGGRKLGLSFVHAPDMLHRLSHECHDHEGDGESKKHLEDHGATRRRTKLVREGESHTRKRSRSSKRSFGRKGRPQSPTSRREIHRKAERGRRKPWSNAYRSSHRARKGDRGAARNPYRGSPARRSRSFRSDARRGGQSAEGLEQSNAAGVGELAQAEQKRTADLEAAEKRHRAKLEALLQKHGAEREELEKKADAAVNANESMLDEVNAKIQDVLKSWEKELQSHHETRERYETDLAGLHAEPHQPLRAGRAGSVLGARGAVPEVPRRTYQGARGRARPRRVEARGAQPRAR